METPPRPRRPRDFPIALGLAAAITLFDVWLLGTPFGTYLTSGPAGPTPLVLIRRLAGTAALLIAQAAFFWASYASPTLIRAMAVGLVGAVTLLEYGFVSGAGGVMTARDIPMAFQSVKYWPSMMRAFADWRALVPPALFALTLALTRRQAVSWTRRWALAALLAVLVHSAYGFAYVKRGIEFGDMSIPAPPMSALESFQRTLVLFTCDTAAEFLRPYRREVVAFRGATQPTLNLVLVIDESISAAHLSVNGYDRPTTPWLEDLRDRGRLTSWRQAASAATYSNASVSSLLTGFNQFPDVAHRVFTLPTIFQFARAMNYRTHLFDGQLTVRRFGLTAADLRYVNDWRNVTAFGDDADTDMRMARAAARVLDGTTGQFMVILKRGNHEPQEENYPHGAGSWAPSRDGPVPAGKDRAAITNTYDNAIRYNLDAFFRALLRPDGTLPRTVGIYTSDHAEMLAEHGGKPFARRLVREVATVPLVLFGDERPPVDTDYPASHHNIFPTLLDLMQVPRAERHWSYGRSLLEARATDRDPRPVLSGYMFGNQYAFEIRDFDALTPSGN